MAENYGRLNNTVDTTPVPGIGGFGIYEATSLFSLSTTPLLHSQTAAFVFPSFSMSFPTYSTMASWSFPSPVSILAVYPRLSF